MKVLIPILMCLMSMGCSDLNPVDPCLDITYELDLSHCFSPELGDVESEQVFFNLVEGEIENDSDNNPIYSIVDRSKIVFVYRRIAENNAGVIDDEFEERVLFQVDEGLEEFTFDSEGLLEDAKITYGACGNSYPSVASEEINGFISGNKTSDCTWDVQANIFIEVFTHTMDTIVFDGSFQF